MNHLPAASQLPQDRCASLVVRVWPDGAVVYDEADGSLHALNPVAGEALQWLLAHPALGPVELARHLLQEEPQASDLQRVNELLRGFESMGLWERPCA